MWNIKSRPWTIRKIKMLAEHELNERIDDRLVCEGGNSVAHQMQRNGSERSDTSRKSGWRSYFTAPRGNGGALVANGASVNRQAPFSQNRSDFSICRRPRGVDPDDHHSCGVQKIQQPIEGRFEGFDRPLSPVDQGNVILPDRKRAICGHCNAPVAAAMQLKHELRAVRTGHDDAVPHRATRESDHRFDNSFAVVGNTRTRSSCQPRELRPDPTRCTLSRSSTRPPRRHRMRRGAHWSTAGTSRFARAPATPLPFVAKGTRSAPARDLIDSNCWSSCMSAIGGQRRAVSCVDEFSAYTAYPRFGEIIETLVTATEHMTGAIKAVIRVSRRL